MGVLGLIAGVSLMMVKSIKTLDGEIIFDQFDCVVMGLSLIAISLCLVFISMKIFSIECE